MGGEGAGLGLGLERLLGVSWQAVVPASDVTDPTRERAWLAQSWKPWELLSHDAVAETATESKSPVALRNELVLLIARESAAVLVPLDDLRTGDPPRFQGGTLAPWNVLPGEGTLPGGSPREGDAMSPGARPGMSAGAKTPLLCRRGSSVCG